MTDRHVPSNPMSAVESVSIRTEERHDGATMYHVVVRVDRSFAAAVAVRNHIAQLVTAPVETPAPQRPASFGDCDECVGGCEKCMPSVKTGADPS